MRRKEKAQHVNGKKCYRGGGILQEDLDALQNELTVKDKELEDALKQIDTLTSEKSVLQTQINSIANKTTKNIERATLTSAGNSQIPSNCYIAIGTVGSTDINSDTLLEANINAFKNNTFYKQMAAYFTPTFNKVSIPYMGKTINAVNQISFKANRNLAILYNMETKTSYDCNMAFNGQTFPATDGASTKGHLGIRTLKSGQSINLTCSSGSSNASTFYIRILIIPQ